MKYLRNSFNYPKNSTQFKLEAKNTNKFLLDENSQAKVNKFLPQSKKEYRI